MTWLRNFRNQYVAQYKQVFVSKQKPRPASLLELLEVRLVVRAPRNVVRPQVGRRVDLIEPRLDQRFLDGSLLALAANLLNQIGVLAKEGVNRLGVLNILGDA